MRRMPGEDISERKEEEGGQTWGGKKTDMTEAGLKEDKTTNRAAWENNNVKSYTIDPRRRDKPGTRKTNTTSPV